MNNQKNAVAARAYVVSVIDCSGTEEQKVKYFFKNFKAEYDFPANRQRYGGPQNLVANYLMGLPSTINMAYTYHDIETLLREWGYLTDKSNETNIEYFLDHYWQIIAMALIVLGRRAGVDI